MSNDEHKGNSMENSVKMSSLYIPDLFVSRVW